MDFDILVGDVNRILPECPKNKFEGCLCDPPYEIGYMGKKWDKSGIAFESSMWNSLLESLKPGAPLLAFGAPRTHHRLMVAIEDAGFEIRDVLMWCYTSGFPKSKTCLKPAWEPIVLAQKPGPHLPLNIDACRVGDEVRWNKSANNTDHSGWGLRPQFENGKQHGKFVQGRWPGNVLFNETDDAFLQKYFFCSKASKTEKNEGLIQPNTHPTVKPLNLTTWLASLILPTQSHMPRMIVPFSGSGSEIIGALHAGWAHITGIELNSEYARTAHTRISFWRKNLTGKAQLSKS